MGAFAYQAIDQTGKSTTGSIEASDMSNASRELRQRGLTVVKLSAGSTRAAREFKVDLSLVPIIGGSGVKSRDVTLFSRQFATMIGAGLTILRSLVILEEQVTNKRFKAVIREVCSDIEAGRPLSDALEKHPRVFDKLYVSMVKAGELGGVLEMTLLRVASSLEARDSLKRKVKSAMTYPTIVLIFALVAALGMMIFIVPTFEKMYADLGTPENPIVLPGMTLGLIKVKEFLFNQWYLAPIPIVGPMMAFSAWKRSASGRRQWHRILLRTPMTIGVIVQKLALARFSRTLSSLISSGVPMMQAVQVTGDSSGNSVIEDAMDDILASIEEGRQFSEPLRRHSIFPPMVIQMANIGEETGKIDEMMEKVAEFYEDEVDALIKSLTSIVEPIMMMLVGGIVGTIIISLYLPMLKVFDQIQQ